MDSEIDRALHETIYQEKQLHLIELANKSNEEERRWRIQMEKRSDSTLASL